MTAYWTILLFLGFVTALNSVALIALIRQVGVLHLRLRPLPALTTEEGPVPGTVLTFSRPLSKLDGIGDFTERILLGFFSPTCGLCGPLLPSFQALEASATEQEAVALVTDAEEERAKEYLQGKKITLSLISEPSAFSSNQVPGAPYSVVCDKNGIVLTAGAVNSLEQLEWLMTEARSEEADERLMVGEGVEA